LSAVTKLFVVLLVVCSLLLVAAQVVFVNRTENYRQLAGDEKAKRQVAEQDSAAARSAEAAARSLIAAIDLQSKEKVRQLNEQIANVASERDKANVQIDALGKQHGVAQAQITLLSEGLKASQTALGSAQDELKNLRTEVGTLREQKGDLDMQIVKVTKENLLLHQQLRLSQEENSSLKQQNQKVSAVLEQHGISMDSRGPLAGPPNIQGVISNITPYRDQFWATISVGSADRVEKNMQFKVVGADGQFMGILTVDHVEPNEAFGRLEGPRVTDVRKNMEVKTVLSPG